MTSLPTTKKLLVIIDGPTASGKTGVGVKLAKHFDSVVISADSRQFYKEMQIGTARPFDAELEGVPHYFLGDRSVVQELSAGSYEREASKVIEEQFKQHDVLFVVGGSGFYIDALLFGIDDIPGIDPEIRSAVKAEFESEGLEAIQERLKKVDPELTEKIDMQNPKRIMRGLEVFDQSGQPLSSFQEGKKEARWPYLRIGLEEERENLYERIDSRVDQMMTEGLEQEVKSLLAHRELRTLRTVGYSEFFPYFDGEYDLERAVELVKRNSRRYAKRQLTWLRNQSDCKWFGRDESDKMIAEIELLLKS